jgi:hypothetical protein
VSQLLINQYLGELDRIRRASGSSRESVLREAFKDLLKGWGRQHDLVFVPEYELDTATRDRRYEDCALPLARLAKKLARPLCKDLAAAGFGPGQIIEAATEIIGQISGGIAGQDEAGR